MSNGTIVPDRTDWHNIVAWRGLADTSEKYVHKGSQLYIEGKLKTRNYEDKAGVRRYVTEIYAESIQILTRKDNANREKEMGDEANSNEIIDSPQDVNDVNENTPF